MAEKVKELEERLDKLENRLKVTFLEIEKRLESFKQEQPMSVEDRLQELEDLLLLIQLEVTKLKDKSDDFGIVAGASAPDIGERLSKLEESVLGGRQQEEAAEVRPAPHTAEHAHAVGSKLYEELEQKLEDLENRMQRPAAAAEKKEISSKLDELEDRLQKLERRPAERAKIRGEKREKGRHEEHVAHETHERGHEDLVEEVRKILYA